MMNAHKYIFLFLFALFAFACEDKLEIEPAQSISGELAVSSEANIINILIGTYDEAGQGPSYGGDLLMMADLLGAGPITSWTGTFIQPREIKNKNILTDNAFVRDYWNNAYEVINQANIVLDNIDIVTSDADLKNSVEGEARFLRALSYFDLARHFTSPTSGLSVPLRTEGILDYSVDLAIDRAQADAVYNLVVSDLQAAVSLLPETNDFFADKYAAEALLARVYLYQGNFQGARDAANSVIANSGHSLAGTYAAAFNNDADSPEDVFAFQVTSQTGANELNTYYADEANGGRGGDVIVNDAYLDLFDDPNDARANFFYPSEQSGDRLTQKWIYQFGNIPLIRLAEMYLIRAEANVELGTQVGDTPLNDLNKLRTRASATLLQGPVTKEMVLNERVLELAFEGFSIHDVVRTKGSVDGFNWDSDKLVMPIPQAEMDTNPSMVQNPGYN